MARAADAETVVLDFDGVIHQYLRPSRSPMDIPNEPVAGAREAIAKLRRKYFVAVCSTRCINPVGQRAVEGWLRKHKIAVDLVTDLKVPARAYVDDRGVPFRGKWPETLRDIEGLVPWNRRKK